RRGVPHGVTGRARRILRRMRTLALALLVLTGGSMSTNAAPPPPHATTFTVAMPEPATHLFSIAMEIAPFAQPVSGFELVMPVWAPGSYAVRDFARNVRDLAASDASGHALAATKVEKSRWKVALP